MRAAGALAPFRVLIRSQVMIRHTELGNATRLGVCFFSGAAVPVGLQMRSHGNQQWRPKPKVQCGTDVSVEKMNTSEVVEELTAMAEDLESAKPESRVSSSVEVTKLLIESMKKNRGKLKRKIEAATNTSLSISKQKTGCFVVVEGSSDDAVMQATKRLQDLLQKVDGRPDAKGDRKASDGVQSLQWVPKAVRGLHTSSVDKMKAAEKEKELFAGNEEQDEIGEETISGSIHVDKKLLRLIKGHKNEVKERLEKSTGTSIRIGSPVVVQGASEESVQKALEEIQKIIDEGVADSKFQYSHFISLPLSMHASLVKQLEDFQQSVLVMLGVPLTEEETAEIKTKTYEAADSEAEASKLQEAGSEMGGDTGTEAAVTTELEAEADIQGVGDNLAEAKASEGQIAEATNKIFKQSVLSSLGIDPEEAKRQELADSVFKDSVLASLGIPAENDQKDEQNTNTQYEEVNSTADVIEVVEAPGDGTVDSEAGRAGMQEGIEVNNVEEPEDEAVTMEHTEVDEDNVKKANLETGAKDGLQESKENEDYEPLKEVEFAKKKTSASGVEPSIFIKPTRFHLTVLMLKLWNEERVEKAREVLLNCVPKVVTALGEKPVSVSLTGLEIMKGSPKNTRVLYAKVSETDGKDRLSRACQVIIDAFVESGLVLGKDCEQVLKLHATVMNTSHRRSKSRYKNKGFDATQILENFGEENWGDHQILEAHLSERFKYDDNGYYHCCGSITFPVEGFPLASSEETKPEFVSLEGTS